MRKLIGAVCIIFAIWVVGCAAEQAAQDKESVHTSNQ